LEQQEAALEGILDLLHHPNFVHDAFVNCDCRIERANLYEDIASLVARTAFPVASGGKAGQPGPLHATSLEALVALLQALAGG
jgi:brefeldin A-resistance guanine nucleotide exchange factor 1